MHGLLLDGAGERVLASDADSPTAEEPWWPAAKVTARHLGPYLATAAPGEAAETGDPVDVRALLLALADRHAPSDPALALRCLDAVAQMPGDLPPEAYRTRRELALEIGA
jgi:hypothetical protein